MPATELDWVEYKPDGAKFTARFPFEPQSNVDSLNRTIAEIGVNDTTYRVLVYEWTPSVPSAVKEKIEGDKEPSAVNVRVVSAEEVTRNGHPGSFVREIADIDGQESEFLMHRLRVYGNGFAYVVSAEGPEDGFDEEGAERFFESFQPEAAVATKTETFSNFGLSFEYPDYLELAEFDAPGLKEVALTTAKEDEIAAFTLEEEALETAEEQLAAFRKEEGGVVEQLGDDKFQLADCSREILGEERVGLRETAFPESKHVISVKETYFVGLDGNRVLKVEFTTRSGTNDLAPVVDAIVKSLAVD